MNHILLAKYFSGECTELERSEIELWKNQSPANGKLFSEFEMIWKSSEADSGDFNPNVENAWNKVSARTKEKANVYWIYRAAVVLIAGLFIGLIYFQISKRDSMNVKTMESYSSDSKTEILLQDSSKVWLNKNSKLIYPDKFVSGTREVELQGEGFFEIRRNPEIPFIIKTGNTLTKVLGTSFDIREENQSDEISVSVVTGKVSFSVSENEVLLTPGELGRYSEKRQILEKTKIKDLNFISWKTGILKFENAPLPEVIEFLSSHYHSEIILKIEHPENIHLTTTINNLPIDKAIEILQQTLDLKVKILNNRYLLSK